MLRIWRLVRAAVAVLHFVRETCLPALLPHCTLPDTSEYRRTDELVDGPNASRITPAVSQSGAEEGG